MYVHIMHPLKFLLLVLSSFTSFSFSYSDTSDTSLLKLEESVVELAVVCDSRFGRTWNNDRKRISDYLTLLFWDMTMQFRTLMKSRVLFRVTSLTILKESEQRLLLGTDPSIDPYDKLGSVSKWLVRQQSHLSQFDTLLILTNENVHEIAVAATSRLIEHACVGYKLTSNPGAIFKRFFKKVLSFFGKKSCEDEYGKDSGKPRFFSKCKDDQIHNHLESDNVACLKVLNEVLAPPVLDPDYDNVINSESIVEQCKKRLNDPSAIVPPEDQNKCKAVRCQTNKKEIRFSPLDNTVCGSGMRCFRGACIEDGFLIANVASDKCLQSHDRFEGNDSPVVVDCPRSSIPTDRFRLKGSSIGQNKLIVAPYIFSEENRVGEKCLCTATATSENIKFCSCNPISTAQFWELVELDDEVYLLKHGASGKCLKQERNKILLSKCNVVDPNFGWRFRQVYPLPGMCGDDGVCNAKLEVDASFRLEEPADLNQSMKIIMTTNISNSGEPAISPAVIISWNTTLKLSSVPNHCVFLHQDVRSTSVKCKLGRLLPTDQVATVVSLELLVSDELQDANFEFSMAASASGNGKLAEKTLISKLVTSFEGEGIIKANGSQKPLQFKRKLLPPETVEGGAFPILGIYFVIAICIGVGILLGVTVFLVFWLRSRREQQCSRPLSSLFQNIPSSPVDNEPRYGPAPTKDNYRNLLRPNEPIYEEIQNHVSRSLLGEASDNEPSAPPQE